MLLSVIIENSAISGFASDVCKDVCKRLLYKTSSTIPGLLFREDPTPTVNHHLARALVRAICETLSLELTYWWSSTPQKIKAHKVFVSSAKNFFLNEVKETRDEENGKWEMFSDICTEKLKKEFKEFQIAALSSQRKQIANDSNSIAQRILDLLEKYLQLYETGTFGGDYKIPKEFRDWIDEERFSQSFYNRFRNELKEEKVSHAFQMDFLSQIFDEIEDNFERIQTQYSELNDHVSGEHDETRRIIEDDGNKTRRRFDQFAISLELRLKKLEQSAQSALDLSKEKEAIDREILEIKLALSDERLMRQQHEKDAKERAEKITSLEKVLESHPSKLMKDAGKALEQYKDNEAFALFEKARKESDIISAEACFQQARIRESEIRFSEAMILYKEAHEKNPENLRYLHYLGLIYIVFAEYEKAIEIFDSTLIVINNTNPQDYSNLAITYNNIGFTRYTKGEYGEALDNYKKALDAFNTSQPSNIYNIATCIYCIGLTYFSKGEYENALTIFEESKNTYSKMPVPDHIAIAVTINSIGLVLYSRGAYEEALKIYQQALENYNKSLPPNHPTIATAYSNIGLTRYNMGKYEDALKDFELAKGILIKFRPDHPRIAALYNNIGLVYLSMEKYQHALDIFKKAKDIQNKYHPDHPDTAASFHNIGSVLEKMGKDSEALKYYRHALFILLNSLPPYHPNIATTYNNMGLLYYATGKYEDALKCHSQAFMIRKKSLPSKHPFIAHSLANVGLAWFAVKKIKLQSFPNKIWRSLTVIFPNKVK